MALLLAQATAVLPQQAPPMQPVPPPAVEEPATPQRPVVPPEPTAAEPALTTTSPGSAPSDAEMAEQEEERASEERRSFSSLTLTLAGLYDDELGITTQHVSGTPSLLGATLLVHRNLSGRSQVVLAYQPEAEVFFGQPSLNAVNQAAGALVSSQLGEFTHFTVGGSYIGAQDPTRYLGSQLLVVPVGPYREGTAYAEIARTVRRTSLQLRIEGSTTHIDSWPGLAINHLEESGAAATLAVAHTLDSRTQFSLSYSYLRPRMTGALAGESDPHLLFDRPIETALLGVSQPFGRLTVTVSGGSLRQEQKLYPLASLDVQTKGALGALRLRYEHAPLSFGLYPANAGENALHFLVPSALLPGKFVDTGAVDFLVRLFQRVSWRQLAWVARSDLPTTGTLNSWGTTGRLTTPLTERFGAFAEIETYHQGSFFGKRLLLGLAFAVAGPEGPAATRLTDSALDRVLPQRRGDLR
ncbi:MAG TPA: hypothetical protein VGE98_09330 [Thermoanaerobaculia bacterium]